jgi:hypothetical protein
MSMEVSSTQNPQLRKSIRFSPALPLKHPVRDDKSPIRWSADSKQCSIGSDGDPVVLTIDVAAFVGVDAP